MLFYVHKQSPNIDLDVVVINKDRHQFPATTPKQFNHGKQQDILSRNEIKHNVFDRFPVTLRSELYPELVVPGLGDRGAKAKLPTALKKLSNALFNNHSFDSVLSDRIPMNRDLPDARGAE